MEDTFERDQLKIVTITLSMVSRFGDADDIKVQQIHLTKKVEDIASSKYEYVVSLVETMNEEKS